MTDRPSRTLIGALSGREITIPDVNVTLPSLAGHGVVVNGTPDQSFGTVDAPHGGFPDSRSPRRRFGLLLPATNTVIEHELWSLLVANQVGGRLGGVGLHSTLVPPPRPDVSSPEGLEQFKRNFLDGMESSVRTALLAAPQYLILGISLEHILSGLDSVRESMASLQTFCDLSWATWQDAAAAALKAVGAKRIGLLTPWEEVGNASGIRMFEDMGFDAAASVGLACGNIQHIAHLPDWAKEKAVLELLATADNRLDAVVQCGTNMGMLNIIDRLESFTGVPILAINPVLFWYALRENGIDDPVVGGGRLLRDC